jgi:hypothetical protein
VGFVFGGPEAPWEEIAFALGETDSCAISDFLGALAGF